MYMYIYYTIHIHTYNYKYYIHYIHYTCDIRIDQGYSRPLPSPQASYKCMRRAIELVGKLLVYA